MLFPLANPCPSPSPGAGPDSTQNLLFHLANPCPSPAREQALAVTLEQRSSGTERSPIFCCPSFSFIFYKNMVLRAYFPPFPSPFFCEVQARPRGGVRAPALGKRKGRGRGGTSFKATKRWHSPKVAFSSHKSLPQPTPGAGPDSAQQQALIQPKSYFFLLQIPAAAQAQEQALAQPKTCFFLLQIHAPAKPRSRPWPYKSLPQPKPRSRP